MRWEDTKGGYVSGESLWLGKIRAAHYFWDPMVPRSDKRNYGTFVALSDTRLGHYKTADEAKAVVEAEVVKWIKDAGLVQIEIQDDDEPEGDQDEVL